MPVGIIYLLVVLKDVNTVPIIIGVFFLVLKGEFVKQVTLMHKCRSASHIKSENAFFSFKYPTLSS